LSETAEAFLVPPGLRFQTETVPGSRFNVELETLNLEQLARRASNVELLNGEGF
jgi:hypothetical protein